MFFIVIRLRVKLSEVANLSVLILLLITFFDESTGDLLLDVILFEVLNV